MKGEGMNEATRAEANRAEATRAVRGRSSPGLRYRNVDGAINWLSKAFGFEVLTVDRDEDGYATYAELSFGSTILMVGAVSGFEIDRYMKQPDDIGGAETQCTYYVVDDIETHFNRARAAGCEIVIGIQSRPNGGRAFTCRDPEGHLWCFGTYDPWQQHKPAIELVPVEQDYATLAPVVAQRPVGNFPTRLAAGVSMGLIASAIAIAWVYGEAWRSSREADAAPSASLGPEGMQFAGEPFQRAIQDARRRLAFERRTRRAAERESQTAQAEASRERSLRIAAEQTARDLGDQLALARHTAEQATKDLNQQLATAREAADQAHREATAAVARAQSAQAAAQSDQSGKAKDDHARLAQEMAAAQQAAADARSEVSRAQVAQAAAERDAKTTRARLTFISHNARQSSDEAITEIRKQVVAEKTAREAAEHQVEQARDNLAHERSLKQAAVENVEQLKKKLASVGGSQTRSGKSSRHVAIAKRVRVAVRPKAAYTQAAPTKTAEEGWSINNGPNFSKETGLPD
jgi:uncharacterized glyoxalase superfamily protein PhnB